jgi:hypothetical protein
MADIRKGELDIKRGKKIPFLQKTSLKPLNCQRKGGYEYTQGKGGITNEQFIL